MSSPLTEKLILENFGLAIIAFMVIVALHLITLHNVVKLFKILFPKSDIGDVRMQHTILLILGVMFLLFSMHMLTNFAWGIFIVLMGVLPNYREGVYYSLENYTGLGLTRVEVADAWRMLAPMISLSGVFCLSWSTALLVSIFGRLYTIIDKRPD